MNHNLEINPDINRSEKQTIKKPFQSIKIYTRTEVIGDFQLNYK